MAYTTATTSPHRFQWETNAAPSQSSNCGPTCVTKIAQFYRDTWFGIQATRNLVTYDRYRGTSATEQALMLGKRGVPNLVMRIDSLTALKQIVASGRRPVVIGVYMARVPAAYRDHPFLGWHAITVMGTGSVNGIGGFWVNDPNFSPAGGIRPDPDRGRKFYPDWVMQNAFINNSPRWAVVPKAAKVVATSSGSLVVRAGAKIRHYPYGGRLLRQLAVATRATRMGDYKGDPYSWYDSNGKLRQSAAPHLWTKVKLSTDGLTGFVIKPFTSTVSATTAIPSDAIDIVEPDIEDMGVPYSEAEASDFIDETVPDLDAPMPDDPRGDDLPVLWRPGQRAETSGLYIGSRGGTEIALSAEDRFPPTLGGAEGWVLVRATSHLPYGIDTDDDLGG